MKDKELRRALGFEVSYKKDPFGAIEFRRFETRLRPIEYQLEIITKNIELLFEYLGVTRVVSPSIPAKASLVKTKKLGLK